MAIVVVSSKENKGNAGMCKFTTVLVVASMDDDGSVIITTTNNLIQQI